MVRAHSPAVPAGSGVPGTWPQWLAELDTYRGQFGDTLVRGTYVAPSGRRLGDWTASQRRKRAAGRLDAGRTRDLDSRGFIWSAQDEAFVRGLADLQAFHAEHGHLRLPSGQSSPPALALRDWSANRRAEHRRGKLPASRVAALDALGFLWEPYEVAYADGRAALVDYVAEFRNAAVPRAYSSASGYRLGSWVSGIRQALAAGKLTAVRIADLDSVGFQWDGHNPASGR